MLGIFSLGGQRLVAFFPSPALGAIPLGRGGYSGRILRLIAVGGKLRVLYIFEIKIYIFLGIIFA